jgi:hypothetical protein
MNGDHTYQVFHTASSFPNIGFAVLIPLMDAHVIAALVTAYVMQARQIPRRPKMGIPRHVLLLSLAAVAPAATSVIAKA